MALVWCEIVDGHVGWAIEGVPQCHYLKVSLGVGSFSLVDVNKETKGESDRFIGGL